MVYLNGLCTYICVIYLTINLYINSDHSGRLNDHTLTMCTTVIKPVYLRNKDLLFDKNNGIRDYELSEAVLKVVSDLKCVQRDRDLWRLYVDSVDSRNKLLNEGFEIRNVNVRGFEVNPYSAGTSSPKENVLKITVKGIPLSVEDNEILKMLESYGVECTSDIKLEKIRNPVTRKMTSILNGNRFVYAKPLPEDKPLPRNSYCAGLRCQIFHYGQASKRSPYCTNCWETTHYRFQCENERRCKVCKKEGHEPGDKTCTYYTETQENIVPFSGHDNILSNFFPCELKVFGHTHSSSEHAYQYAKAIRCGDIPKASVIRDARTALDAKRIGDTVIKSDTFKKEEMSLMEEVLVAKMEQVPSFKAELSKSSVNTIFVETTFDDQWGSGLNRNGTMFTLSEKWPGKNVLGEMMGKLASRCRPSTTDWRQPPTKKDKKHKTKRKQANLSDVARELQTPSKRDHTGRKKSQSEGNSPLSSPSDSDMEEG